MPEDYLPAIRLWLVLSPTNDCVWYGENTDQRGTRTRFLAGNTPEERAELAYNTQVLLFKIN